MFGWVRQPRNADAARWTPNVDARPFGSGAVGSGAVSSHVVGSGAAGSAGMSVGRVVVTSGSQAMALARELLDPSRSPAAFAAPRITERRLLHWSMITDPWASVPAAPPGVDVRVLLPEAPEFDALHVLVKSAGIACRRVRHLVDAETVSTLDKDGRLGPIWACPGFLPVANTAQLAPPRRTGASAEAARDAFELAWDSHDGPFTPDWTPVDAASLVPPAWVPYLGRPTLNPAQVEAAPHILRGESHVVVVAPTGSGKTIIGMLAALKAILGDGRKAAWLVPQRSLTDELDRELSTWRARGLRVERLSGEHVTDVEKVRRADLWVSTTEKFEAVCRSSSLRTALAEVGCLVVDEIHLLGSAARGPLLEALLARVRGADSPVRIVGLSATVANAEQVADWLGARVVSSSWRPTRLTWQVPMVPASSDRRAANASRLAATLAITRMITDDEGSVLVFCGSRRNVRATALAIAADRGAVIAGVDPDDADAVHRACARAGVGLHYKGWEYRHEAEREFRARRLEVLVATTTVAAGVNLPARAVVVRDTQIGLDRIDVATVQQMFGRAGRIGAGETEGWAYLICDESERATWQSRLVEGYTVRSHIADSLADHLLAEAAQDRIATFADAENWWLRTFAHHQGADGVSPVSDAVDLLVSGAYLTVSTSGPRPTESDDPSPRSCDVLLTVTDLGLLTTRFMVPVEIGIELREHVDGVDVPDAPEEAEWVLAGALGRVVPEFAEAPIAEELRPQVARLLRARGHRDRLDEPGRAPGLSPSTGVEPGDLARVAFALVANSPALFTRPGRTIAGIPTPALTPILADSPRYFAWLAAQGGLGTVHPWVAIVAGDLGRRIRWRRLGATRGAGRLLWMCEQMATPTLAEGVVPELFSAARRRDVSNPDWPVGRPPTGCRLDHGAYVALLRDRATDASATERDGQVILHGSATVTAALWSGPNRLTVPLPRTDPTPYPTSDAPPADRGPGDRAPSSHGVALFTRRGDARSTGWLAAYNSIGTTATAADALLPPRGLIG